MVTLELIIMVFRLIVVICFIIIVVDYPLQVGKTFVGRSLVVMIVNVIEIYNLVVIINRVNDHNKGVINDVREDLNVSNNGTIIVKVSIDFVNYD